MSPRRRALILVVAVAAAITAGAVMFGPRVAGNLAAGRLVEELAKRGIVAEIGSMQVGLREVVARDVCVFDVPPNSSRRVACIERIEVAFPGGGPLQGETTPSRVAVLGGQVYAEAEHGELGGRVDAWRRHLAESRPPRERRENTAQPASTPVETATEVLITNLDVALSGHDGLPVQGVVVERLETVVGNAEVAVDAHLELVSPELPSPLEGVIPTEWDLALRLENGEPKQLQLHPEGRLELAAPSLAPGLVVRLDGGGIAWPYHLTAFGVEVAEADSGPLLSWATATLTLRELTTSLEQLYFTNLEVSSPRVYVRLDENGQLDLPAPFRRRAGEAPGSEGSGDPAGDTEAAADEGSGIDGAVEPTPDAAGEAGPWAGRIWWEQIPQRIALTDLEVHAVREGHDGPPTVLFAERLEYALRIFNFQLDVSLTGGLRRGTEPAGTASVQVVWGWESSNLRLDLDLNALDLSVLTALLCDADCAGYAGQLDLDAALREDERGPGMRFSGALALRDAVLPLPLLQQPLSVPSLSYRWEAERSREVEPVALRFSTGELAIGEARANVRPALHGFRYDRYPPIRQIDVSLDIPEQPAQTLLEAVPASLQGPIAGTRLAGTFAFGLDFPVIFEPDDSGRLGIRIEPPTRFERVDGTMAIEAMPEGVDPRRMLGAFTFTFRGPEDRLQRVIRVPGPATGTAEEELPIDSHPWARLDDISWYLIATQLYREDGRFFANSGINWYQLRRVLQEAWAERALGRGASTITMQLVKNVLLSHERTIERKLQELFLTYWTTRLVPKERLLEIYLNVIEWGPGINGVVEAADYYFGTTPAELTVSEAVWLSAITPAPARRAAQRELGTPPAWMQRQIADLARGLAQRRWISPSELEAALTQPVEFVGSRSSARNSEAAEGSGGGMPDNAATSPEGDAQSAPVDPWATPPSEAGSSAGRSLAEVPPSARLQMLIEQAPQRTTAR